MILAVTGAKGGTAKTTTSTNLAAELAARGVRVELRDLDPQASATLALGGQPVADPWTEAPVELHGIRVRPAGRALALVERGQRSAGPLMQALEGTEVLIIDCPPAVGPLTLGALSAATLALVPLKPTPLDLPALTDIVEALQTLPSPPELRVALVQAQTRRLLTSDVRELLARDYPSALCLSEIPEDVRAAEAPGFGLPIRVHAPGARSADAYSRLTDELFLERAR